jgi:eukaryotic-like serine/threonine-protein kinase
MARLARLLPSLMPDEPATTDLDWTTLQGTTLEGGFQLETILSADEDHAAFKVRVLGHSAANAFANLILLDATAAEEQVTLWQQLRRLKGTHLSVPLGAGQATVDGATLAFVVLTRPDETLDAILAERPLTPREASECLSAVVAGLEELHAHGLVHGCIAPEHIFSIGESIKLSSDCARAATTASALPRLRVRYQAPEQQNATPEADVWCVGATLVEILTQQPCREPLAQAESLPPPFNNIARKCLEPDPAARPRPGQIEALSRGRAVSSEPKQPIAAAAAAGAAYASHATSAAATSHPTPPPRRANLSPRPATPSESVVDLHKHPARPLWPYLAAAALVALLVIWLWPRHRSQAAAPGHPAPAWESKTVPPAEAPLTSSQAAPQPSASVPASKAGPAGPGQVWRVVLYAYRRETDAANKARAINARHPDLNAGTFSPTGGSPYLVVAGGRLTHDDAARLLQRARSLGLPRDSYIQNYAP